MIFAKKIAIYAFMVMAVVTGLFLTSYSQEKDEDPTFERDESSSASFSRHAREIEDTWNVLVTIRNCQTGAPLANFKAMDLFIRGGSVVDTNAAPPSTRGPGFGSWKYLGRRNFTSTLRFFLYNPDGSLMGVRRIEQDIKLAADSNSWNSTVSITVFDPAGNQVATACATADATRAE